MIQDLDYDDVSVTVNGLSVTVEILKATHDYFNVCLTIPFREHPSKFTRFSTNFELRNDRKERP